MFVEIIFRSFKSSLEVLFATVRSIYGIRSKIYVEFHLIHFHHSCSMMMKFLRLTSVPKLLLTESAFIALVRSRFLMYLQMKHSENILLTTPLTFILMETKFLKYYISNNHIKRN